MPGPFDFNERQDVEDDAGDYSPSHRSGEPPKSRTAYILLALFLGYLGIHNFYAGRTSVGVMQLIGVPLVLTMLTVLAIFTAGLGLVVLIPAVFIAMAWPLVDIVTVKKDGRGRWMQ